MTTTQRERARVTREAVIARLRQMGEATRDDLIGLCRGSLEQRRAELSRAIEYERRLGHIQTSGPRKRPVYRWVGPVEGEPEVPRTVRQHIIAHGRAGGEISTSALIHLSGGATRKDARSHPRRVFAEMVARGELEVSVQGRSGKQPTVYVLTPEMRGRR